MKKQIIKILKNLEKQNKIKILFAIENGSRAWRMASKDSDYDVRFVFHRNSKEYLKLNKSIDVINASYDENLKPCKPEGALIDISGFDIFKFAELLYSSNPTTIEWLVSDIVYYGKQNRTFKNFALKNFSKIALYYHYKSMCKNNYLKYLKTSNDVTYKRYLYSFRGLINAKCVMHKKSIPPIIFIDAVKEIKGIVPDSVLKKIHEMIEIKSQGKEKDKISNIPYIDNYIEKFIKEIENPEKVLKPDINILNKEIQKILK